MSGASETRSTCPYCGVGCGVIIESRADRIVGVRGDPDHPANAGRLCTKGSTLHLTTSAPVTRMTRLLQPAHRLARGADPVPLSWDDALDQAAGRFATVIAEQGPDAVGFYVSGQLLTEDYYVFNKLAKGLIGTNNIDTNSRLCMSSAVAGYKQTLGADAPPACYEDIEHADVIFIAGANPAVAHPILFRRIEAARRTRPNLKLIVADPRRTETAAVADLHLPVLPGSDVALFHGMLHLLVWNGQVDRGFIAAHTQGFEALRARLSEFHPQQVARSCGIGIDALTEAARLFGQAGAALSLYCQGLNQSSSGTAKNSALINLHLATGQIGRPGAGPLSLTGQPNAMGGREVGGMANLLSGHRDLSDPAHRAEVARLWGVTDVPAAPGKPAIEMFQAAADGEIRALWIACTNPAQSLPDQSMVRRALQRAEYVVVQEAFATTATCAYADLLLPASSWGEKEGTVTNSERRISRVRAAVPPPGAARADWQIAADFARRLERRLDAGPARRPKPSRALFPYDTPEQVWNEHRETTRGRDLDITALSYERLEQAPQQWPCAEADRAGSVTTASATGTVRLYGDGVFATADGRARFADVAFSPLAELADARFPFSLNTGRLRDQWHGMSRTGVVGRLFGQVAEPTVELNPIDLDRRGLVAGELVRVTSRRGSIVLPVSAGESSGRMQAWIPMHWGGEFLSGRAPGGGRLAGVNELSNPARCATSRQPELKHSAVKIERAALPWSLLAAAWLPQDEALAALAALRALMGEFAFAAVVPFGREPLDSDGSSTLGVMFRAADAQAPAPAMLAVLEKIFGLAGPSLIRYADPAAGQHRAMLLSPGSSTSSSTNAAVSQASRSLQTLQAFLLAGDTSAESWIRTLLQERLPAQGYGRLLLRAGSVAPAAVVARGRQVCACFDVTEAAIQAAARAAAGNADERLAALQRQLQCGTQCGSCLPEVRRLVDDNLPLVTEDSFQ
jgi:assimilatory nitrate reductase catalytic subunit